MEDIRSRNEQNYIIKHNQYIINLLNGLITFSSSSGSPTAKVKHGARTLAQKLEICIGHNIRVDIYILDTATMSNGMVLTCNYKVWSLFGESDVSSEGLAQGCVVAIAMRKYP